MFSHPHYPTKTANTLASLVKGEVLSPEKIRATTGGIASLLSLALHQPFQNRTIPLAFRRVRVCVCLVGFASLQSPWAHTLKASLPCLPLPLHRPSPFLQPLQKNTYHLPCLPLPLHHLSILTTFSKAHPSFTPHHPFAPHPSFSHYSSSNIHFLPVYP